MNANPLSSRRPLRRACRSALLVAATLPFLAMMEPPCDSTDANEPDVEQPVQIGVRVEMGGNICRYFYTVLNRSRDTLTTVVIGWDGGRDSCELVAGRHAAPDTTSSPQGYECAPWQSEDPNSFSLGWSLVDTLAGGIPPDTLISGFTVTLPRPEPIYERLHWVARYRSRSRLAYGGALKPERELDVPVSGTGTISGRVVDERGRGIPYPSVVVKRGMSRPVSKPDGSYVIADVPAGTVRLIARTAGYGPCEKARVWVAPNRITRVDFRLAALRAADDASRAPSSSGDRRSPTSSDPRVDPPSPCALYTTATDRIRLPFPGGLIDTVGAVLLDRRSAVPSRSPGDTSRRRAYFYASSEREIHFAYQGVGEDTIGRAFTAEVRRNFQNADEEHLLRIAEETYPPLEAVLAIAEDRPGRPPVERQERLWWYGSFDGVRLPYSITLDAVRYYTKLVQTMGKGESVDGFRMKRAKFSYNANISPRRSTESRDGRVFRDVYVVEMRLSWSNYCGSLCACSFNLDRTVILRRDGTVLCVFGDRKPMVVVS